jgi:hypothetical protein
MNYKELSHVAIKAAEFAEEYTLQNDIIKNPGKFEGETVATLYYYDAYMNGNGTVMDVTEEERVIFELDESDKFVYLAESNDGFVSLEFYETETEAEAAEAEDSEDEFSEDEFSEDDDETDDDETEAVYCPMCAGEGRLMGGLGNLTYYRCIQCGWEFTA